MVARCTKKIKAKNSTQNRVFSSFVKPFGFGAIGLVETRNVELKGSRVEGIKLSKVSQKGG